MKKILTCLVLLFLTGTALASGYTTGNAFKTIDRAVACGTPTSRVSWTGHTAIQHFQKCAIKAHFTILTPTSVPKPTAVPPTVEPTQIWNTPTPIPTQAPTDPEHYLLGLINQTRAQNGVPPLQLNATQSNCSMGHSRDMAASGTIWHQNPSYPATSFPNDLCVSFSTAGENVGMAAYGDVTAGLNVIHQEMMSEPHDPATCASTTNHACNILNAAFSSVGIAVYLTGTTPWVTEDFVGGGGFARRALSTPLVLGDSITCAAGSNLAALGFYPDCAIGRQWAYSYWASFGEPYHLVVGGLQEAQKLRLGGYLPHTVVVALGTNGPITWANVLQMLQILRGHRVAFVTNYALPGSNAARWTGENNALLWRAHYAFHVPLVLWSRVAPRYIDDSDGLGVHPTPAGRAVFARLIRQAL